MGARADTAKDGNAAAVSREDIGWRKESRMKVKTSLTLIVTLALQVSLSAQAPYPPGAAQAPGQSPQNPLTIEELNRRIEQHSAPPPATIGPLDYRLGPEDLIEVAVFEAPELGAVARISPTGRLTLPLLGPVHASGLTPREFELVVEELLRQRGYMHDPHASVSVREMRSHGVSVIGAVQKSGVYQLHGSKTLIEVLSLASGLAEDAGDTVLVARRESLRGAPPPAETPDAPPGDLNGLPGGLQETRVLSVDLRQLLYSADEALNVPIFPGDIVKVSQAGIVYVVGDVKKPGGFKLKNNESITVLQAIALAEGMNRTAAQTRARIIRTGADGQRRELPLNLAQLLRGRSPDPVLQPKDIVFVPSSTGKTAAYRGMESALQIVTGLIIWRR